MLPNATFCGSASISDGSVVSANLGVNPSLTITALAERAMGFIPMKRENMWEDEAEVSCQSPVASRQ